MILVDKKKLKIKNPEFLNSFNNSELEKLRNYELNGDCSFYLPDRFVKNNSRRIYKTGFLFSFLNKLHPLKNRDDICKIMNNRYHVFLEKRQVERYAISFNSDEFYIN